MGAKKTLIRTAAVRKVTNMQFLKKISEIAPEYSKLMSQLGDKVFTEAGYQAMKQLPATGNGSNESRFFNIGLLVGLQYVDFVSGKDVLEKYGILERFNMDLGSYMQRNQVARIHNVNPGWLGTDGNGLKDGDHFSPFITRKPRIMQQYYGLNSNYQNYFSWQDFDLKRGWLDPNGIGDILAQVYNMVALDRKEWEFALFFKVFSGALNSSEYPLQETQQIVLSSWTDAAPTDTELNDLVINVKNVCEALDTVPATAAFNAMEYPNDATVGDHVLLVRQGIKARFEKVFGYAFNEERLQFPVEVHAVPNFGGVRYYTEAEGVRTYLQPVYKEGGITVGYIDENVTVNGYAFWDSANSRWLVNVTTGGATADTTIVSMEDALQEDPNEDVIAVLAQRGVIFELIQNPMTVEPIYNPRTMENFPYFNQPDNGINYNHGRNLVTFSKPAAE